MTRTEKINCGPWIKLYGAYVREIIGSTKTAMLLDPERDQAFYLDSKNGWTRIYRAEKWTLSALDKEAARRNPGLVFPA